MNALKNYRGGMQLYSSLSSHTKFGIVNVGRLHFVYEWNMLYVSDIDNIFSVRARRLSLICSFKLYTHKECVKIALFEEMSE